ncbi:MAG: hypothetical protein WBM78_11175 [Desulfobacterales bacterium]
MTIESEGISMPKWADADITHKITGIHADAKIKNFFTCSSFKNKKTTGIWHLHGAHYHRGFKFEVESLGYSVTAGFYRPLGVSYTDTVDQSIKKTGLSLNDIPVRPRRLKGAELS